MKRCISLAHAIVVLLVGSAPAFALTNVSSVIDSSGALSGGGSFTNVSAAGQPGGIAVSSAGTLVNYAGFLNTFVLKPGLDTDGDGLADEVDTDNDNDGLADSTELGGSGFDPVTVTGLNDPDTDNDGTADGDEAAAGTDPTDASARLRIVKITPSAGNASGQYLARGGSVTGKTYVIHSSDTATGIPGAPVVTNATPASGTAPWYVVTNSFSQAAGSSNRFFTVQVLP